MPFGQLVIGPPGSGKTTYCNGMQQFLSLLGRKAAIVNLDPANDRLPYECAVDIRELISLEEVQDEEGLGPNGGLVYCMDFMQQNMDWLREQLMPLETEGYYFIFDCPGQVELFTLDDALTSILKVMTDDWHLRLTAVHLVDAHLTADPGKFLAAALLSLSTMLHLGLPHVNALSKVDLVASYGRPAFGLEFYTEVENLRQLADVMADEGGASGTTFPPRFRRLTAALCEVVDDFGLLRFIPLHIEDKHSVRALLAQIDKANGYAFTGLPDTEGGFPSELAHSAAATDYGDLAAEFEDKFMPAEVTERDSVLGTQQ